MRNTLRNLWKKSWENPWKNSRLFSVDPLEESLENIPEEISGKCQGEIFGGFTEFPARDDKIS